MTAAVDDTAAQRYVADIITLHDRIRVGGLREAIVGEPIHVLEPGDGLLTISVRESQLPDRYLRCLLGFRLAQYARLGWIDPQFVFRRALFHEERRAVSESTHTVCLCTGSGKVRGYIGLSGSEDSQPLPLDAPDRGRFPVEIAHDIDLLGRHRAPGWTTHHVFEGKRFIRDYAMPAGPLAARVPWHVLLGFGRTLVQLGGVRSRVLLIGDGVERHLTLMGLDMEIVSGTSPSLPKTDPLWPRYVRNARVKPFFGHVPPSYRDDLELIERFLSSAENCNSMRPMVTALQRRRRALVQQRGSGR